MTGTPLDAATISDEEQVLALSREWVDAEVRRDLATIERILDDRFVCTWPNGTTVDKIGFIGEIRRSSWVSQALSDTIVHIHGDTAVEVGTGTAGYIADGKEASAPYRYTVVYVKRQGEWRAIAEQLGPLAPNT
jgi:ketosteroid isomerase-like protein